MEHYMIHILSDSTGETVEAVIRSAIYQFKTNNYRIIKHSYVASAGEIDQICRKVAKNEKSLLYYTFVKKEMADYMKEASKRYDIESVDIYSSILNSMSHLFHQEPIEKPGSNRRLDESYYKRIDAIEFSVMYDDGRDPRGIEKADIVLIGISRTSKTPLSIYLANKNIKVANVPLFPESQPPKELFVIDPVKIIGLTNSPEKLNEIRRERLKSLGMPDQSKYAGRERILEELEYASDVMAKLGCKVINVSNKAIEETADIIISYLSAINQKV